MECPEDRIEKALAAGPLSTANLAEAIGEDPKKVYRCCRDMESRGLLQSTRAQGTRLLFCVEHKQVVTAAIYEECKAEDHQMAVFYNQVRIWSLAGRRPHAARTRDHPRRRRAA